ncbi:MULTISPECIES: hypothetical protein [Burkholderia]|uniref:Holin n=1 Tax=Burkholderia contaminans TaxID=488447 RepID=A0A2S5DRI5_9BURK|nr:MULTISPECIES: hypothetical protein [Burkholderia]EKS9798226.1 hypothetical protein [Burkholderia cepacia]EKS9808373.1 hypothetical protein [Burkholderia cepacia]EKS9815983.1 hypothetical protein [Burkholderia cepacia]EKS9823577.1 hypothetical protein [Burkholderia cepacia]EKS9827305.1 hypothetical protein [Burkholderia cepacia]
MTKETIANGASAVANATSPIAVPTGGVVTWWTWLTGHDISWFVGALTIVLLLLQIRDRLFPRRTQGGAQ